MGFNSGFKGLIYWISHSRTCRHIHHPFGRCV